MSITLISKVKTPTRCPKCANRGIVRSSTQAGRGLDRLALWDFTQACIICGWETTTSSVKVGA